MKIESALNESWSERIQAAQAHPGGYAGYCREHGIREHKMHYQRKKLQTPWPKQSDAPPRKGQRKATFLPIVLEQETSFSKTPGAPHPLPDAKWGSRIHFGVTHGEWPPTRAIREFQGVFLHRDPVDGRRAINGLSEIVEQAQMGPLQGPNLFVFCGKRRDVIKILYFDKSGFAVWQKRLEVEKFPWPKTKTCDERVLKLTAEQMQWLLDGYDVWKMKPFGIFSFSKVS